MRKTNLTSAFFQMNVFWEKAARRSGRLFIGLVLLAIIASVFAFFDLEKIARSPDEQKIDQDAFSAAVIAKYYQVFAEIAGREESYRRAKESLYPDVF